MFNKKEFLGEDLISKYCDIFPIIDLILFRVCDGEYGELFSFDYEKPSKVRNRIEVKELMFIRFLRKLHFSEKIRDVNDIYKQTHNVLVSDSLLLSERNDSLVEAISKRVQICCFSYSIEKSFLYKIGLVAIGRSKRKERIENKLNKFKGIYVEKSVIGNQLKIQVARTYYLFKELLDNEIVIDLNNKEVSDCLDSLAELVRGKIEDICTMLENNNIDLYITYNQLRLVDLLCIMSCKKMGIFTKEINHYSYFSVDYRYWEPHYIKDYYKRQLIVYSDENCQWGNVEQQNAKLSPDCNANAIITSVGCPEICLEDLQNELREDKVLLFIPSSIELKILEKEIGRTVKIEEIIRQVSRFSHNNNCKLYLRYHPRFRPSRMDLAMFKKYDVKLCGKESQDLKNMLKTCKYAFGGISSATMIAMYYGVNTYKYIDGGDADLLKELNIDTVELEKIPYMIVEYKDYHIDKLEWRKKWCVNIEKILEVRNAKRIVEE